jgi:MFS family permease
MLKTYLRISLPLAGMNFVSQAARGVMSEVGPVLAAQYTLSAFELGLLSSVAFASYCLWQLPLGMLLDRWGPRIVQTLMGLTAGAGFALFAVSDSLTGFIIARLLIGVGIAAGLMALLKAHSVWFERAQVAGATGVGMLIASSAGLMVTALMEAALPTL